MKRLTVSGLVIGDVLVVSLALALMLCGEPKFSPLGVFIALFIVVVALTFNIRILKKRG